jgi:hypothetical protein
MSNPAEMKITRDRYWIRFGVATESSSFTGNQGGKYLFFSKDQDALIQLAKDEINEHDFEVAKVSTTNRTGDYVLCLYWGDDSRKVELMRRTVNMPDIKYRWWKSNEDTREGKYSQKYINSLPFRGDDGIYEDFPEDWSDAFGIFHE